MKNKIAEFTIDDNNIGIEYIPDNKETHFMVADAAIGIALIEGWKPAKHLLDKMIKNIKDL